MSARYRAPVPRTTVDIDAPVLAELKRRARRDGATLGRLVSDLLAQALGRTRGRPPAPAPFEWVARPMRALVDLDDKEALQAALDRASGA